MSTLVKKLSSRKLWACIAGVVLGIATYVGADNNTIQAVSGAVISALTLIEYIRSEAKVDAASAESTANINTIVDKVKETAEKITAAVDTIKEMGSTNAISGANDTVSETNDSNTNATEIAATTAESK